MLWRDITSTKGGGPLFGLPALREEMLKPRQPSLVLLARDARRLRPSAVTMKGAIITLMQRLCTIKAHPSHISYLGVPHADVTTGKRARRLQAYRRFAKTQPLCRGFPARAWHGCRDMGSRQRADLNSTTRCGVRDQIPWRWVRTNIYRNNASTSCRLPSVGGTPLMKFLHGDHHRRSGHALASPADEPAAPVEQINGRTEPRQIVIPSIFHNRRKSVCDLRPISGTFPHFRRPFEGVGLRSGHVHPSICRGVS